MQANSSFPEDVVVLSDPRGTAKYGYAYHRIGEDGTPLCRPDRGVLEEMTVAQAHRKNKVPCGMCTRLGES